MATVQAPCGWLPDAPCSSGPCCPDTADPVIHARANAIAAAVLWRLTGMRFGCCELTVRPCKPKTCDPLTLSQVIYWDQRYGTSGAGNLGVLSFFPTLIDGQVYNISCGCPTGCCKCEADCEVRLPGPVCSVTSVIVAGVALTAGIDYYVLDGNKLVFIGDTCPPCQNYNVPAGGPGTWTVTYSIGTPVPDELNFAAGVYACEIAKALVNDKSCALPERVKAVTRQGITSAFFDPTTLLKDGLTGLSVVDQIIKAINPYGHREPARVWYPGMPRIRREAP